ncbi:Phosphatidylinositol 4-kinase beta [Strongyloides ratti]|uniref:Phosphatidylinositol 4-kinase beta n=1 Tax=Strongyloides ratti TaxID=34506 RepID=A0A090L0Y6_STRRB|nr:Phosphatidylinositol 4-kinase beta [Strongyloides ratti]CEF63341.1 Phosphatidylinositol 4-kinase beta [Strongyloides ratti]
MQRSYIQKPSEFCNHPKNGVCPRCSLKASFDNIDENRKDEIYNITTNISTQSTSSLLRFFDSTFFTIHHAIHHLQSSLDSNALLHLGNSLFKFPKQSVDFYLPQLLLLYVNKRQVAEHIHSYLMERCQESIEFSVNCVILLESFNTDNWKINRSGCRGYKLKQQILNEFYRNGAKYDQIHFIKPTVESLEINTCECIEEFDLSKCNLLQVMKYVCECGMKKFRPELEFIQSLIGIGNYLKEIPAGIERTNKLFSSIDKLNENLPSRVWLPLYSDTTHFILKIVPKIACVLNSKDRAPFYVIMEAVEVDNICRSTLPNDVINLSINELKEKYKNYDNENDIFSMKINESNIDEESKQSSIFSESWDSLYSKIKRDSIYSFLPNWTILPVIVKTGDDLRQELIAYQLLCLFQEIWTSEYIPLYLKPYRINVLSADAGLIEPIKNAISLHQLKKKLSMENENGIPPTLLEYFITKYGSIDTVNFIKARQNFVRSCAAYSLICYFLQVKDRHNGNILLDEDGHLIHIDFGFILNQSPKNLGFETSPFKLTPEIVDLMGGPTGEDFEEYKLLMLRGLIATRKHHDRIISLMNIMTNDCQIPCFRYGPSLVKGMLERFHISLTDDELHELIFNMVEYSRGSLTTRLYDNFQYYTNGIL